MDVLFSLVTGIDFSRINVKHPVELEGEVKGAGDNDDTEVVYDEVALRDGQHHPILFLQVAHHPGHKIGDEGHSERQYWKGYFCDNLIVQPKTNIFNKEPKKERKNERQTICKKKRDNRVVLDMVVFQIGLFCFFCILR